MNCIIAFVVGLLLAVAGKLWWPAIQMEVAFISVPVVLIIFRYAPT